MSTNLDASRFSHGIGHGVRPVDLADTQYHLSRPLEHPATTRSSLIRIDGLLDDLPQTVDHYILNLQQPLLDHTLKK